MLTFLCRLVQGGLWLWVCGDRPEEGGYAESRTSLSPAVLRNSPSWGLWYPPECAQEDKRAGAGVPFTAWVHFSASFLSNQGWAQQGLGVGGSPGALICNALLGLYTILGAQRYDIQKEKVNIH